MGRKRDRFWDYAVEQGSSFKCKFCDRVFTGGGATRIKAHLAGVVGHDIAACVGPGATLRSRQGGPTTTLTLKKKKIIYNILKFFIYLPLQKKKLGTPSKKIRNTLRFFNANKIKFWWIICSTFKQKEKAQHKILK